MIFIQVTSIPNENRSPGPTGKINADPVDPVQWHAIFHNVHHHGNEGSLIRENEAASWCLVTVSNKTTMYS
jgi:uncharacterized damage-inducible protein DinB